MITRELSLIKYLPVKMEKIILGCVTENLHYLNLSKCILLCVETVNNNLCYILIVSCGED